MMEKGDLVKVTVHTQPVCTHIYRVLDVRPPVPELNEHVLLADVTCEITVGWVSKAFLEAVAS